MNLPNLGKYASVSDLPYSPQKITYHRGYGNIVVHEIRSDNTINTTISKYNRIDPLVLPFGDHLPKTSSTNNTMNSYVMSNPETTIAWNDKRFYE
jgi:hypothetical protein